MISALAPTGQAPEALAETAFTRRPRLLLIERDEAMSLTLARALAAHHEVETVPDGIAAALSARSQPPDLVIVDLYLPGADQLTFIRSMHANPRTAGISIIILAASMDRELLLRCLNIGASNFLLKPFNVTELLMCVRIELRLRESFVEPARP